jgi:hypothetical protein
LFLRGNTSPSPFALLFVLPIIVLRLYELFGLNVQGLS